MIPPDPGIIDDSVEEIIELLCLVDTLEFDVGFAQMIDVFLHPHSGIDFAMDLIDKGRLISLMDWLQRSVTMFHSTILI